MGIAAIHVMDSDEGHMLTEVIGLMTQGPSRGGACEHDTVSHRGGLARATELRLGPAEEGEAIFGSATCFEAVSLT